MTAPDIFEKFNALLEARSGLPLDGENPLNIQMEQILSPTEAVIEGRHTILAGTNNYMGLTFDPRTIAAARQGLEQGGTGTTGSRAANGTYASHKELERKVAEFYGTAHAIVFSTGYQANLAAISTLAGPKDFILIDADSHASIYDACKMSSATIVRFRHNDPADLDKRLARLDADAVKLIVVEGIYSVLGDKAPMADFVAVKKKYPGAYLLVDEAHSLGVLGETGRGACQEAGVEEDVDFIVGTFSKSVGTIGGFAVSNHPKFEVLRLAARAYIFTASLPPSVVAGAIAAFDLIGGSNLRQKLWDNATRLHAGLSAAGFDLGAPPSPVIAVKLPDIETACRFWVQLFRSGVYVNLFVPPATPSGMYLLRCSLSAAHSFEQIDTIIERFTKLGREFDLLKQAAE